MTDNTELPPPVEEPVVQGDDGDEPATKEPTSDAAPAAAASSPGGDDGENEIGKGSVPDVAAATAAAAAVAARLMAGHGQQTYPVSSGADHAQTQGLEGGNNKRAREETEADDGLEGPEKKRASSAMLNAGLNGGDPTTNDPAGANAGGDPTGGPPSAEMVSETFDVPAAMVGKLIGKGGETIRNLQVSTDTRIQVDHTGEGPNKRITVSGYTADHVQRAKAAIMALETTTEENQRIVECPPNVVGRIIGRGGETIRALQSASEAHITVNQDFPPDHPRQVVIQGNAESIERAVLMVHELIHGEPGSAQAIIQRVCHAHGIGKSEVMTAPKMIIGRIIGRGGETIKQIQKVTGATVQIEQQGDPCKLTLAGQPGAVDQAKSYITEIINGGDPFNPGGGMGMGMGGGYGGGGGGGPGFGGMPPGGPGGYGGYPAYPAYGAYPAAATAGYGGYPGAMYGGGYGGYPAGPDMYAAYGGGGPAQYGGPMGGGGGGGGYPGPGGEGHGGPGPSGGGPQAGGQPQASPAAPGGGGGGWQEYHDEQGRAYYYNATTGVTQWEKPADL